MTLRPMRRGDRRGQRIGAAVVERLVASGARVAIWDLDITSPDCGCPRCRRTGCSSNRSMWPMRRAWLTLPRGRKPHLAGLMCWSTARDRGATAAPGRLSG